MITQFYRFITNHLPLSVKSLLKPLIPSSIRRMIKYHMTLPEKEVRYNMNQIQKMEAILNGHGYSIKEFISILDFGCGSGRLTQYLPDIAINAKIYGCDVDQEAISFAQKSYPGVNFSVNQTNPPIHFENEQFDLIILFGVFTNISEHIHKSWLEELPSKLKNNGILIVTSHSPLCLRRIAMFSPFSLNHYHLPKPLKEYLKNPLGYHFVPYVNSSDYGVSIIDKKYVFENWPKFSGLKIIGYYDAAIEAYPEGCHDIVLLKKE